MMEQYGGDGVNEFNYWTIFGDPSLRIVGTTAPPEGMKVKPGSGLTAEGPKGGPFTPDSITYELINYDPTPLDFTVSKSATWIDLSDTSGTIPAGGMVEVTVSINETAAGLPKGFYEDEVSFVNTTTHVGDATRAVALTVGVPQPVYTYDFDEDPGWTMNGEWQFGKPQGQGGYSHGYADPTSGATGDNVYGINLAGDYSTSVGSWMYLTSGAIDCSDVTEVSLHFQRWLNTDYQSYVYATLEISTDGSSWKEIWDNGSSEIAENKWSEQVYDIAAEADGAETLYIRWGHKVGSSGAYAYSGWNIDDVEIWGVAPDEPGVPCPPTDFEIIRGELMDGGLEELVYSDDQRLEVRLGVVLSSAEPPVWLEVTGEALVPEPSELHVKLEAHATTVGLTQRIELWDCVAGAWVELDTGYAKTTDMEILIPITDTPARFVDPGTLEITGRFTWKANGPVTLYPWQVNIDQIMWYVVE